MGNAGDPPPPSPSGPPSPPTPAASVGASSTPAAGSATPTTSDTSPHAPPPSTRSPNKGAGRPPRSYTGAVPPPASFTLTPIAHVRSPYTERFGTPRQPPVTEGTLHGTAQRGAIVLDPAAFPGGPSQMAAALAGLDGFSHVWVVTVLHLNGDGWRASVKPPRGDRARRVGVFATRSPHRPNRLGLSALRIVGVAPDAGVVDVQGLDLLDGTPVLDLKPYVAYTDGVGVGGRGGWVEEVADAVEPDYLSYSPRPPHLEAPPPALRPSPPSSTGSV